MCLLCFLTALAEILSVKEVSGRKLYYVHYIDCEYSLCLFLHFFSRFDSELQFSKNKVKLITAFFNIAS